MRKLTIEFNDGMTKLLESLANGRGTTKVDVIRNALALYYYVNEEVLKKEGLKLAISSNEDKVIKEIVLT